METRMLETRSAIAVGRRLRQIIGRLGLGSSYTVESHRYGICDIYIGDLSRRPAPETSWKLCAAIYAELTVSTLEAVFIFIDWCPLPANAADYINQLISHYIRPRLPIDVVALGWATAEQWEVASRLVDDVREQGGRSDTDIMGMARLLAPGEPPASTVGPLQPALF